MSGSLAICLTPDGSAEEPCSTAGGLVVPLRVLITGVSTIDKSGNSCASMVETDTGFPVNATTPIFTPNEHAAGTVTTYDSSTGTGDLFCYRLYRW